MQYVDDEGNIFAPEVSADGSVLTNTPDGVKKQAAVSDDGVMTAGYVGPSAKGLAEDVAEEQQEIADARKYNEERALAIVDAIETGGAENAIEIAEEAIEITQEAVDVRDQAGEELATNTAVMEGLEDLDAAAEVADAASQALDAAQTALEEAGSAEEVAAAEAQLEAAETAVNDAQAAEQAVQDAAEEAAVQAVNEVAAAQEAVAENEAAVANATNDLVDAVADIEETSAAAQAAIDAALAAGFSQEEIDNFIASLGAAEAEQTQNKRVDMRRSSSSKHVEIGRTTYQDDNPLAALLGDTQSAASAAIAAAQAAIAAVSVAETAQTESNALLDLWTTEATQTLSLIHI